MSARPVDLLNVPHGVKALPVRRLWLPMAMDLMMEREDVVFVFHVANVDRIQSLRLVARKDCKEIPDLWGIPLFCLDKDGRVCPARSPTAEEKRAKAWSMI